MRGSVEETLNELLEAEAENLTQAARYERNEQRQGCRSGHYSRHLTTASGDVTLKAPKLKGISFETAIIERYRRRESSVEETLIEMYLAGVSVRRVEDITEALWGSNHGCTRRAKNPQYVAENLLNRQFYADRPNQKWLTDVTEFKWYEGIVVHKLYLSAILDLCDRRIVSYALSERNDNPLVYKTFDKAVKANPDAHPLFHSDRGVPVHQQNLSPQTSTGRDDTEYVSCSALY